MIVEAVLGRYNQAGVDNRNARPIHHNVGVSGVEPASRIQIDLGAIEHNLETVRDALRAGAGSASATPAVCAVLKADAYALGAPRIARRLEGLGIDMIAVYTPAQARELIDGAIGTPILLLMPVRSFTRDDRLYRAASRGQLHLTVHDAQNLDAIVDIADALAIVLPVHLELDTGMSRGGVPIGDGLTQAGGLLARIDEHPRLRLAGVYTHFASADCDDELTRAQHERFEAWLDEHDDQIPDDCMIHEANTFGLFRATEFHRRMVRIGLALLGYASEEFGDPDLFELQDEAAGLRPVVRWTSRVVQLKDIPPGTPVGYRSTWRAERPTRLALVPVGYADGYPLSLSSTGSVGFDLPDAITGYAPVVGRVSMDQITVDVTDLPREAVRVGSVAEIVSTRPDAPNSLPNLAAKAGTITHELLCRIGSRIPRTYVLGIRDEAATGGTALPTRVPSPQRGVRL